jgi:hypothetical protein
MAAYWTVALRRGLGLRQCGEIDPALFQLIGHAIGQVQAAQMQQQAVGGEPKHRTHILRPCRHLAGQKPVAIDGTRAFDLGAHQRNFKPRRP